MSKRNFNKRVMCMLLSSMVICSNVVFAQDIITKEESVFVLMNQNGESENQIISNWIHSDNILGEFTDKSSLSNIKNLKGSETFTQDNENLSWNISRNDLFYQGESNKELPLKVSIKYYLDDKEISSDELAGKSGKVKIKISIKNTDAHIVTVNGKNKTLYTPFTAAVALNLPIDTFKNVKLTSGEFIEDGNNQAISFVCFPGMAESFKGEKLLGEQLNFMDSFEIECDAENFKLDSVMIVATPILPELDSLNDIENIDELTSSLDALQDASMKLRDGTFTLSEGSTEFSNKMDELNNAVSRLGAGSQDIHSGTKKLRDSVSFLSNKINSTNKDANGNPLGLLGAYSEILKGLENLNQAINAEGTDSNGNPLGLKSAIDTLYTEVNKLNSSNSDSSEINKLVDGFNQIYDSMNKLNIGINSTEVDANGNPLGLKTLSTQVKLGVDKIAENSAATTSKLEKLQNNLIEAYKNNPNDQNIKEAISLLNDLTNNNAGDQLAQLQRGATALDTNLGSIGDNLNSQLLPGMQQFKAGIDDLSSSLQNKELFAAVSKLQEATTQIGNALQAQLMPGAHKFNDALKELGVKVDQDLYTGVSKLYDGTEILNSSITKNLLSGVSMANDASKKLSEGSNELALNMDKFNKEGIDKMHSEVNTKVSDLDEILAIKDELVNLSKEYESFSGINDDMDGKVKFIMKTDSIKAPQVSKAVTNTDKKENSGFINWLKKLFKIS